MHGFHICVHIPISFTFLFSYCCILFDCSFNLTLISMANYQGLDCIMGEITTMVSDARYPHDQHIYDYFTATEKFVRIASVQLFQDCILSAVGDRKVKPEFEVWKQKILPVFSLQKGSVPYPCAV